MQQTKPTGSNPRPNTKSFNRARVAIRRRKASRMFQGCGR